MPENVDTNNPHPIPSYVEEHKDQKFDDQGSPSADGQSLSEIHKALEAADADSKDALSRRFDRARGSMIELCNASFAKVRDSLLDGYRSKSLAALRARSGPGDTASAIEKAIFDAETEIGLINLEISEVDTEIEDLRSQVSSAT